MVLPSVVVMMASLSPTFALSKSNGSLEGTVIELILLAFLSIFDRVISSKVFWLAG